VIAKLWKFLALPKSEQALLVESWWWLLIMDQRLRWLRFSRVRQGAGKVEDSSPRRLGGPTRQQIDRIAWSVEVAARQHLHPMHCLVRSLTLQRLLARRGVGTELRLGVSKEQESLAAHAWVELDGEPISERGPVEARYLPLVNAAARR
jgi:hypothetical protein